MSLITVVTEEGKALWEEAWKDHRDIITRLDSLSKPLFGEFEHALFFPVNRPATIAKIAGYQAIRWRMTTWLSPHREEILEAMALMNKLAERYAPSHRLVLHFELAVLDSQREFCECALPMLAWECQQPFTKGFGILHDWIDDQAFRKLTEIMISPRLSQLLLSSTGRGAPMSALAKWIYDRCDGVDAPEYDLSLLSAYQDPERTRRRLDGLVPKLAALVNERPNPSLSLA